MSFLQRQLEDPVRFARIKWLFYIGLALIVLERRCLTVRSTTKVRWHPTIPQSVFFQCDNYIPLVAAGMAADQYPAIFGFVDRQARLTIQMGGAARHPAVAGAARALQTAGDGLG